MLKILPPKLRTNRLNQKILERVHRPTPGNLVSPFEAIRSGEIMPIFLERFNVLAMHESNAIMRLVIPQGAKIDYLENEDTKSLFELLYYLDQLLIQRRVLEPAAIQCLFAPK